LAHGPCPMPHACTGCIERVGKDFSAACTATIVGLQRMGRTLGSASTTLFCDQKKKYYYFLHIRFRVLAPMQSFINCDRRIFELSILRTHNAAAVALCNGQTIREQELLCRAMHSTHLRIRNS
jgi:hypothetical protein